MAKPKLGKEKKPRAARALKEGQQESLTLAPDYSRPFPTYYSNFAYVSHTNSEVIVDFCLFALPYSVNLEDKEAAAQVVSRIVIPPKLINGFVKALEAQRDKQQVTAESKAIAIPIPKNRKG